jgi:CRP/FNR family transcriptional regulator
MSTEFATSKTRLLEVNPLTNSARKACSSRAAAFADVDSSAALKSDSFRLNLSEPSTRAINGIAQVLRRPKGTIVFYEGDTVRGVYILFEGRANVITADSGGKTFVLKVALPGDVLGLNSVFADTFHSATVETVQACRFAFIAREDFVKLTKEHSDACFFFAQRLGRECHSTYEMIRSMARPILRRLAGFLISCCANGCEEGGVVRTNLVLTHEAIAQRIGCSRETVSRTLSCLKRKRAVELAGTTLLVYDRTALESLNANYFPAQNRVSVANY